MLRISAGNTYPTYYIRGNQYLDVTKYTIIIYYINLFKKTSNAVFELVIQSALWET